MRLGFHLQECTLCFRKPEKECKRIFLIFNEETEAQKAKTRATVVAAEKQILISSSDF